MRQGSETMENVGNSQKYARMAQGIASRITGGCGSFNDKWKLYEQLKQLGESYEVRKAIARAAATLLVEKCNTDTHQLIIGLLYNDIRKAGDHRGVALARVYAAFHVISSFLIQRQVHEAITVAIEVQQVHAIASSKSLWVQYWNRKILLVASYHKKFMDLLLPEVQEFYHVAQKTLSIDFFDAYSPKTRDEKRAEAGLANTLSDAQQTFPLVMDVLPCFDTSIGIGKKEIRRRHGKKA